MTSPPIGSRQSVKVPSASSQLTSAPAGTYPQLQPGRGPSLPGRLGTRLMSVSRGEEVGMTPGKASLPPRWFIKTACSAPTDRASEPRPQGAVASAPGKWGALRLTTTGRRSGEPRGVILGYYQDGPNLVSMAMNGWGRPPRLTGLKTRIGASKCPLSQDVKGKRRGRYAFSGTDPPEVGAPALVAGPGFVNRGCAGVP